jgi:predicted Zn-dependent protease
MFTTGSKLRPKSCRQHVFFRWRAITLGVLLAGVGCTRPTPTSTFESGIARTKQFVGEYGAVTSTSCPRYLKGILARTIGARGSSFEVIVLATPLPLALSPGGNKILVSKGLLLLLSTEAQASFMLTHEAGHYILNHLQLATDAARKESSEDRIEVRRELEIEADTFALSRIVAASYEPTEAVAALSAVYRGVEASGRASEYPSLQDRILALSTLVLQAHSLGSGIADRRGFKQCQFELRGY